MHRFQVWAFLLCAVACACALLDGYCGHEEKRTDKIGAELIFAFCDFIAACRNPTRVGFDKRRKDMDNPLSNFPDGQSRG
jgi:hypothetical protein